VIVMIAWRLRAPSFWRERPSVADPALVHSHGAREES
jgi:hypothetical protein